VGDERQHDRWGRQCWYPPSRLAGHYHRDFNGDGKADLLLQNSISGEVGVDEMDGNVAFKFDDIATPDPGWVVKKAADFTGHGGADILLQNNSTLQTQLWAMTGTARTSVVNIGTPDPGWHIAA